MKAVLLARLGRTSLVGVASRTLVSAMAAAAPFGAATYTDVERMLDDLRPELAYVCVPPAHSVPICRLLVKREIPFLVEKPLAAIDSEGPAELAFDIERRGLVVGVGYHLRALEALPEIRRRLAANPAHLVVARWLDATPPRSWWWTEASGGGQVIEQATHLYDLARLLVGEASVIAAESIRGGAPRPAGADVADATAATLRFDTGALGSFTNSRHLSAARVEIAFASEGLLTTIAKSGTDPGAWTVTLADAEGVRSIPPGRDPYERQAERFLDAVEGHDPGGVFCTYSDALTTDRLTRAVVVATGQPG